MAREVKIDIAIIGGGIAGMWLLNRVRQEGFSAALFESHTVGGAQSTHSQGIIHSGVKYALKGKATNALESLSEMPQIWQNCLSGEGEIDLTRAKVLSEHQHLWHQGGIASKITSFFASRALKSKVRNLKAEEFPDVFKHTEFGGSVYELQEPVLDVASVMKELTKPVKHDVYQYDWLNAEFELGSAGIKHATLSVGGEATEVHAQYYIFTAGEGNEALLEKIGLEAPKMQRRPLHMVYLKGENLPEIYAHCMQAGSKPRITITTHPINDNLKAWYLGGEVAESGVDRSREEQILHAREELETLLPWVSLENTKWNSFIIDRAELAQPHHKRPDAPSYDNIGNMVFAWPTKLAFAPALAQAIMHEYLNLTPNAQVSGLEYLSQLPKPQIAEPQWMF